MEYYAAIQMIIVRQMNKWLGHAVERKKSMSPYTIWTHFDDKMIYAYEWRKQSNEQKYFFLPKFFFFNVNNEIIE